MNKIYYKVKNNIIIRAILKEDFMCRVGSGASIKNRQDLQNLVIGIINRQQQYYRVEDILDLVQYYLEGSSINLSVEQLRKIITDNLDMLYIRNRVKCINGCYIPQPLNQICNEAS